MSQLTGQHANAAHILTTEAILAGKLWCEEVIRTRLCATCHITWCMPSECAQAYI